MQRILQHTLYCFLVIFGLTALLTLAALAYLWFIADGSRQDLPYLSGLIAALIIEIVAVIIGIAKRGYRYLPSVEIHKDPSDTTQFMSKFVAGGSTVQIVSNRAAWLAADAKLLEVLEKLVREQSQIQLFVSSTLSQELCGRFTEQGIVVYQSTDSIPPDARFTLVNGYRSGAAKLAIARGSHPDHEVTVFDTHSGPQIIALARDIIRLRLAKGSTDEN